MELRRGGFRHSRGVGSRCPGGARCLLRPMRIAINAISATAGGAQTYILNLKRALPALGSHEYRLYIPRSAAQALGGLPANFQLMHSRWAERGYAARLLWEQVMLPYAVKQWRADVLICAGNFCPL